jgi:hypothetical protein
MTSKIIVIALGAALCIASEAASAASVTCNVAQLKAQWLDKHTHVKTLSSTFPEVLRRLTQAGADSDYEDQYFGGTTAKQDFTNLIAASSSGLNTAIQRAALSQQEPCYVCTLQANYQRATQAANKCVTLIQTVNNRYPGLGSFNCEKLKDFTRPDMEAQSLNASFWQDVERYQKNLEEDVQGPDVGQVIQDMDKVRRQLQIFVTFHDANTKPGDAQKLKDDIESVGGRCTGFVSFRAE